ncbi:hypothetical protein C7T35_39505 [Variovorax sp. WS11]|uniref:hypothetical protein n=1 Tax=Variovorax sp. WS11 TaxID=1105204 RepID=UPI000D0D9668|nr:hypothetical protein [Variovorax sp. WS11]NDZ18862.1 hypothetical protein [Variovorax sp. WS11]PSL79067.1 hypothetical protein C7T35_39505 [Variovorax sp. WS11]
MHPDDSLFPIEILQAETLNFGRAQAVQGRKDRMALTVHTRRRRPEGLATSRYLKIATSTVCATTTPLDPLPENPPRAARGDESRISRLSEFQ